MLSYGGSALIANLLAVGVLLGCARREPDARRMLARRAKRPVSRMTTVTGSRATAAAPRR
jgi:cell division protein FtsW